MVLIYGASGTGKSWAAERYGETHSGAYYTTMTPVVRSMTGLLGIVAEAIGVAPDSRSGLAAQRVVVTALRDRSALIIVDEAHHLTPRLLDQLRCVRDVARCGLGLVGDESIMMPLGRCPQILGRVGGAIHKRLPSEPDVELLVSAFLERPATRREIRMGLAAARGPGGLHALRRMLARAWMMARIEDREEVTLADLEIASTGIASDPDEQPVREARA